VRTVSAALAAPASGLPTREDVMGQAGSENFTVASAILGRRRQAHLLAIYGFARLVDDVGDEAAGNRSALLDRVQAELDAIYAGAAPEHPVMTVLAETVRACRLPAEPFGRLIEANRRDQLVTRYETFQELLGYCQLSAAPVGELVLGVFGSATPDRIAMSDRICAALQVIEHLQDISEDYARGRVYMPREDLVRLGCDDHDLSGEPTAGRQALIAFQAERAGSLLSSGAPLARTLSPRPRLAVAGFVAGGRAALAALITPGVNRQRAFAACFAKAVMGR
jgi:squalene synthase HpnC